MSALVESLCHHHGLADGEAQLAGGLLLQRGGGEGRCGHALHGLAGDALHAELGVAALLEEGQRLLVGAETGGELAVDHLAVALARQHQLGADVVVGFALESLYLALAFHDEPDGDALHATCREGRLHLAPEHRRELEAHQAVQHAARLLRVYKVHVQVARMLDGLQDGRLRDLVEHDAVGVHLVQPQHLAQVPGDGFSLAVFIACQPDLFGLLGLLLQFADEPLLLFGYLIVGQQRVAVDAYFFLLQVADVAVAGHHLEVFS